MKFATGGIERSYITSASGFGKKESGNSGERVCGPCRLVALTSRRIFEIQCQGLTAPY